MTLPYALKEGDRLPKPETCVKEGTLIEWQRLIEDLYDKVCDRIDHGAHLERVCTELEQWMDKANLFVDENAL